MTSTRSATRMGAGAGGATSLTPRRAKASIGVLPKARVVRAKLAFDADYWLALLAVVVGLGAVGYLHFCWREPNPGPQVFHSTAAPPLPVRWNGLGEPECPNCGGEVVHKADRCTHCGRCFAWRTAPWRACDGAGHLSVHPTAVKPSSA